MKLNTRRFIALFLSMVFVFLMLPANTTVPRVNALGNGTVIYYEDFNYADDSVKSSVLSTLGWETSTAQRANQTNYSIIGGRLYCDSISTSATGDSYVTVLDDVAMSEVAANDYTISYKLCYAAAEGYTRYGCALYNYNGYKSYNSVHVRIAGYGNNQVRSAAKWHDYDDSASAYYMKASGTSSLSYKLYGVESASANATSNTNYPFVGKTLTVRIAVDVDTGATVYINGTKVSVPTATYKELFLSTQQYASAIGFKTSKDVQLYIDDFMVYTGLGDIPSNVTKESVSYVRPTSNEDKNAIKVMTFNTLFDNQSTDIFGNGIKRTNRMYNVVSGLHPDIVGMQERSAANMNGVTSMLISDADYAIVTDYRTDTTVANVVHNTPILYNTKRFSLVANDAGNNNSANGALLFDKSYNIKDKTPEEIAAYAGTKGMCWAVLKDKKTGGYVLALNAHFALNGSSYTNYTDEEALEARLSNASQILEKMEGVYAAFGVIPTVLTGDFNMRISDPAYKKLSKYFENSIYANDDFVKHEYTMNKITGADFTRAPNLPIDHIFYNDEALVPTKYYVGNKAPELMVASDHLPVMTTFSYKKVIAPTPSHITSVYSEPQLVSLRGNGEIYYTTDGSDPRTSQTRKLYGGAISITADTLLKSTAKVNGIYSDVNRITLFFSTPFFITEVIKNAPGTDHTEGFEIINVSDVEVDLSDFTVWAYSNADEAALVASTGANATSQMPMAHKDGSAVIPSGAIAYCPIVIGDTYLSADKISSTESAYLVTLNDDATKVTYHKDRYAQAIAYDGSGNISSELIFPIDRTARSIGYTDSGVAVRRHDYYNATDGNINNLASHFSFGNSNYTKVYITLSTAADATEALCVATLDSTDSGITTTDTATSVAAGGFNFVPTAGAAMLTQSFSAKASIGSLTEEQKVVFDALFKSKHGKDSIAVSSAEEFAAMAADGKYYLTADITLSSSYSSVFTGSLDGKGHTVTTTVPMFNDMSGTIKNLVVNGDISAASGYNAAVSKQVTGNASFENITTNANLTGGTTTGGIVGYGVGGAKISIVRCINNGSVSGTSQTGGILGYAQGALLVVDECINNGKIYSTSYAAGVIGRFGKNASTMSYRCNITNCENNGEVSTPSLRAAGIIAYTIGNITISGCTNYGYIHYEGAVTEFNAGGIYGEGGNTYTSNGTSVNTKNALLITDCYNYGRIEGTASAGGIMGKAPAVGPVSGYNYVIDSCGNMGDIICVDGGASRGTKGAGGIAGYFYGTTNNGIFRCFNVGNISVTANANASTVRACGLVSYFNGTKSYFKDCYNAGTVTASGTGSVAYQLFYNNNATGGGADCIVNNHAIAVNGATYQINGTQANNTSTFTTAELSNGTLRDRINSGSSVNCYFQDPAKQLYPVLREYKGFEIWGIVLAENSSYTENNTQICKVPLKTSAESFVGEFRSDVKVLNGNNTITSTDIIGTGYKVSSFDGKQQKSIAVTGDVDGNAQLSASDVISVQLSIMGTATLSGVYAQAADINGNGSIDSVDYITIISGVTGAISKF